MSFPAIYPRNRHQRGTVIMDNNVESTTHLVANISSVWYLAAITAAVLAAVVALVEVLAAVVALAAEDKQNLSYTLLYSI